DRGCAKQSLEKGKGRSLKLSKTARFETLMVGSRPAKECRQPEASLAWTTVTSAAKRRQRAGGPCDGTSKCMRLWWPTRSATRKATAEAQRVGTKSRRHAHLPHRGLRARHAGRGWSRNLGDPTVGRRSKPTTAQRAKSTASGERRKSECRVV